MKWILSSVLYLTYSWIQLREVGQRSDEGKKGAQVGNSEMRVENVALPI